MKFGILICLGAALACAQPGPRGFGRQAAADLGLTAEQQNKIHTVVSDAQVQAKGMREQSRTLRDQLDAAIKASDDAKIDSLTQDMARVDAQLMAIQAKAQAKIYSSLTADQKAKVDQRPGALRSLLGRGGSGPGGRPGAPPQ